MSGQGPSGGFAMAKVYIFFFPFLVASGLAQQPFSSSKSPQSPEALAKALLKCLARADTQALAMLFPTEQDLYQTIETSGMAGADRGERNGQVPWIVATAAHENRKQFNGYIKGDQTTSPSFAKAKIRDITVEMVPGMETEFADVTLKFEAKGAIYYLSLQEVFKTPRGWVLGILGFECGPGIIGCPLR
jgi:hypothetical protein